MQPHAGQYIVQWKPHTVAAVFFLVWIVLLLWVKQQVPHVCVIHLAEQEAVAAHSMGSYVLFYLSLCLLAGAVMDVCCAGLVSKLCCVPPVAGRGDTWGAFIIPVSAETGGCSVLLSGVWIPEWKLVYSGAHTFGGIGDF